MGFLKRTRQGLTSKAYTMQQSKEKQSPITRTGKQKPAGKQEQRKPWARDDKRSRFAQLGV